MAHTYQIGLAGFGRSGEVYHAPYIAKNPHFELTTVYERTGARAEALYPRVRTVRSFEALLGSDVDVVVLCVPNALHFSMTKAALAAGKHVVVEKPLAPTAAEGAELFRLAEQAGKLLCVYQNRRFDGGFRAAKELLSAGTLGEVVEWESRFDRWAPDIRVNPWKETVQPASGMVYDLGSHLADEVVSLFGAPDAVWADLGVERQGGAIDDDFLIRLFYGEDAPAGATVPHRPNLRATLRACCLAGDAGETPRLTVRGRKGAFTVWGGADDKQTGKLFLMGENGKERVDTPVGENAYECFYDALYESLAQGKPFPVTGEQAVAVLGILEGALESARTGNKVALKR